VLSRFKRKTREKIYRVFVWVFLGVFVFSVAAVSLITLLSHPTTPTGQ
jgi:hypothetical protein